MNSSSELKCVTVHFSKVDANHENRHFRSKLKPTAIQKIYINFGNKRSQSDEAESLQTPTRTPTRRHLLRCGVNKV